MISIDIYIYIQKMQTKNIYIYIYIYIYIQYSKTREASMFWTLEAAFGCNFDDGLMVVFKAPASGVEK